MRTVLFAVLVSALLTVSALATGWAVMAQPTAAPQPGEAAHGYGTLGLSTAPGGFRPSSVQIPIPVTQVCTATEVIPFTFNLLGPGCNYVYSIGKILAAGPSATAAADNIATFAGNSLNATASLIETTNATLQELLSYFETRAEAIVPYFLNATWTTNTSNAILVDSGLVPAIEGMQVAYGEQEWQDWNATLGSWNADFGSGSTFSSTRAQFVWIAPGHRTGGSIVTANGYNLAVSPPFEYWNPPATGSAGYYLNMAPGGTILQAPAPNSGNLTVDDLTTGGSFRVPIISNASFYAGSSYPIEARLNHVGQFDLLKIVCSGACPGATTGYVLTTGVYVFERVIAAPNGPFANSGIYRMTVVNNSTTKGPVWPYTALGFCITVGAPGTCTTPSVGSEGNTTATGSGPGSLASMGSAMNWYGQTAENLTANVVTMARAYYNVLRAVTDNGTYAIPADCIVPPPSDAFPSDTDPAVYNLSLTNLEAVYLSYLNAEAALYGASFTNGVDFCGDPHLGISFSWAGSWKLALNISASVYLGTPAGPVWPNGSADPSETLSSIGTWAVRSIAPILLYPFEYQADIPVGIVYPVPVNDPMAAVLVNYTGNNLYGSETGTTAGVTNWGVPDYLSLNGNGNYVYVSGALSNVPSGEANATGDAVYLQSCALNGTQENPCNLAVTYFNNFTIGIEHALVGPGGCSGIGCGVFGTGGTGLAALGSGCGFTALNQWYDGWAGFIGSAVASAFTYLGSGASGVPIIGAGIAWLVAGLGCVIAWIIVILACVFIVYLVGSVIVGVIRSFSRRARQGRAAS